jgi:YbbR domain-containing protein
MSVDLRPKLPIMLLSMIVSLALFFYVRSQEQPESVPGVFSLDIEARNVPPGMDVKLSPTKVTWQAIGSADQIVGIDGEKLEAYVDLSDVTEGERRLPIKLEAPAYPGVKWTPLTTVSLAKVELRITREIPIQVETTGQANFNNLLYNDAVTEPKTVLVQGPRSYVESIEKATVLLDLSKVSNGMAYESTVVLVNKRGDRVANAQADPDKVMILPAFVVSPEEKPVYVNASCNGQPGAGFAVKRIDVNPERIRVKGRSQTISSFNVVETDAIDITALTETKTFKVPVLLPNGVKAVGSGEVEVTVVIVPRPTPEAPLQNP